jgi:hypothetical protein
MPQKHTQDRQNTKVITKYIEYEEWLFDVAQAKF